MYQSLPGLLIKLRAHKFDLRTNFLSSFTGKFDFQSGAGHLVFSREPEMRSESVVVESETQHAQPFAIAVVIVERGHVRVSVQSAAILVHLSLRVHILEKAGIVPPFWRSLHQYFVWLEFFDEFLGSLGEHGRRVCSANEVDILSIEPLGQVD